MTDDGRFLALGTIVVLAAATFARRGSSAVRLASAGLSKTPSEARGAPLLRLQNWMREAYDRKKLEWDPKKRRALIFEFEMPASPPPLEIGGKFGPEYREIDRWSLHQDGSSSTFELWRDQDKFVDGTDPYLLLDLAAEEVKAAIGKSPYRFSLVDKVQTPLELGIVIERTVRPSGNVVYRVVLKRGAGDERAWFDDVELSRDEADEIHSGGRAIRLASPLLARSPSPLSPRAVRLRDFEAFLERRFREIGGKAYIDSVIAADGAAYLSLFGTPPLDEAGQIEFRRWAIRDWWFDPGKYRSKVGVKRTFKKTLNGYNLTKDKAHPDRPYDIYDDIRDRSEESLERLIIGVANEIAIVTGDSPYIFDKYTPVRIIGDKNTAHQSVVDMRIGMYGPEYRVSRGFGDSRKDLGWFSEDKLKEPPMKAAVKRKK